ncbi:major facilitator superfamily transporter [Colletotrichum kahawae]|uniref:Major facilitator superfamily transporter n=1 Tax=Colletotrichum kahawae TaxID=34407 RepID=A0AAD9YJ91_COLKA|nr:major facilitator superfamily transporter [Colletotrichum kahawae]
MAASQPHEEHKREVVENEHGDHAVHVEGDEYHEAMKIEEQSAPTWSKEEEGQALRKLDWNLIPLLGALYLVSYIDRGNVGNAYTAGMGEEWGITSEDYSWIVTILYIGYILFHWLILVWTFVPLPLWTALMAIGWGSMSMLQAATHNFAGILVLRFLVGAFEAGFVPAVALYMTFFYHRGEMGLRYGLFISFSPIASCFASALAYGLVSAKSSIPNWELLFLVGFPDDSPGDSRLLLSTTIALRVPAFAAFYDYKNYLQALIIFCLNTAFGSLPAYLPTILQAMGYTSLHAQGFSACPYLAAYVVCVTASFVSDRFRTRGVFIVLFCCTGAVGYVLLATIHTTGVRYFATFLVCAGVFPAVALTFTWVTDNQGSASKRGAGLAIFGMVGQCGPILGARLFPKTDQPWYAKGMWTCAGILFAAAALATILSLCLRFQNKMRDEKYGKSDLDYVPTEVADKGDDHPMYRYVL